MPPHHFSTYNNFYDCFKNGYEESLRKTKEIGKEQINEHKIFMRFNCVEQPSEQEEKGNKINV